MKKVHFFIVFIAMNWASSIMAQTENESNKFKNKNVVHLGFGAQIIPNVENGFGFSGYSGLNLGLEHSVGKHWSYALNVASISGPTLDNELELVPAFRTRMIMVGPEFRFYTLANQRGLFLGLSTNYIQQRILVNRLDAGNNNFAISQGGFNVNALIGFQSQIGNNIYAHFKTGLGITGLSQSEYGTLNIPFVLGLGYRF